MDSMAGRLPTRGELLWLGCGLAACVVATAVFSCAPEVLLRRPIPLSAAYRAKSHDPFADTQTVTEDLPGERSHSAKLTPRVFGAVLLAAARVTGQHPYLPATLFGFVFLLSGLVVGQRLTSERMLGLTLGLTYAGLYAAADCFSMNLGPKPFDGVALGLVGLVTMALPHPWLTAATAFLALWTDERAAVALGLVAVLVAAWPAASGRQRASMWAALLAAAIAYAITRAATALACGWAPPDFSDVLVLRGSRPTPIATYLVTYWNIGAWLCCEGAWCLVGFAIWRLWQTGRTFFAAVFAAAAVAAVASCFVVLDVSRAASYAFPLIPAAYAVLAADPEGRRLLLPLAAAAAGITLLAPNFEVVIGYTVRYILPLLPRLLS
jgi:hypothetical protein